uniref:F-box domain-containing protein n=1 Tax=Caenorhabditis tropicalis TaxID=1561998 RepID=A0A1I7T7K2_9PELO
MTESSAFWERLPFHFKHNVVDLLDFESRHHLRLCSKSDRILVDSCSMNISKLAIFLHKTTVSPVQRSANDWKIKLILKILHANTML